MKIQKILIWIPIIGTLMVLFQIITNQGLKSILNNCSQFVYFATLISQILTTSTIVILALLYL